MNRNWWIIALMMFALLGVASANLLEYQLTTGGTEESLSTLTTISQLGNNTYATFVSNETDDNTTVDITINYMTADYKLKSTTYALNGVTAVVTTATNYVYDIPTSVGDGALALTLTDGAFTSAGKNASLTCANYTNVYRIEYTSANYTPDMNATLATALDNTDDGTTATLYDVHMTEIVFGNDTYPTLMWRHYNPALTITGWSNTTNLVLPAGEYFAGSTPFTSTPESMTGTVTITQNAGLRTYNLSTNDTASQGYYTIPSAQLVQNKRLIVPAGDLVNCVNATLAVTYEDDITTTAYSRSGAQADAVNDIAYIYAANLSQAAAGNVSVNNTVGTVLLIEPGNTTPVSNDGAKMCLNPSGCIVNNLFYGGDAFWKISAKILAKDGTSTTALAVYQIAGTGNWGSNTIRFAPGERLIWYGLPYTSGMNISLNYEVK